MRINTTQHYCCAYCGWGGPECMDLILSLMWECSVCKRVNEFRVEGEVRDKKTAKLYLEDLSTKELNKQDENN